MTITVRPFAAARDALGATELRIDVAAGSTVDDLLRRLGEGDGDAARVLASCSVLVDGVAGAPASRLDDGAVVDVLPPFAGG